MKVATIVYSLIFQVKHPEIKITFWDSLPDINFTEVKKINSGRYLSEKVIKNLSVGEEIGRQFSPQHSR